MKIKLCTENEEQIEAAIRKAMGRALSFCHSYADVQELAEKANKRLDEFGLLVKDRCGIRAVGRLKGPPNSYRYSAAASSIQISRGAKDWFLIDASRDVVYPKQKERLDLFVSEEQRDKAVQNLCKTLKIYACE